MNNPNPFVPKGSLLEQQSKRRSRMKLGVFCVLAVSVTGLMAMLIQGCKRENETADNTDNSTPTVDTNNFAADTNPPTMEVSNPPVPAPTPAVAPTSAPAPEPATTEYVVVKGDTLGKIARKNGVTLKALEDANPNVQPSRLKVGQKIVIPASSSGATVAPAANETSTGEELYTVKSGDSLTKIAKAHGVTVKALESENGLTTTKIKVGQKLKIPAKTELAPTPEATPAPAPATVAPAPTAPTGAPAGQQ
ncbi:MAG TPA: LysM peptidoglycan-binding domain-containing protein [Verrucomicrobiae bacterium]|nr:LysM peptidoglycan-binding domain-containing protein [Verrucomicrobiae bacterium]